MRLQAFALFGLKPGQAANIDFLNDDILELLTDSAPLNLNIAINSIGREDGLVALSWRLTSSLDIGIRGPPRVGVRSGPPDAVAEARMRTFLAQLSWSQSAAMAGPARRRRPPGRRLLQRPRAAFGLQLGWALISAPTSATNGAPSSNNPTKPSGIAGGIEAGYNWQFGQFVVRRRNRHPSCRRPTTRSRRGKFSNPWFGTLRGRAGVAIGNVLLFGTAGLAYGSLTARHRRATCRRPDQLSAGRPASASKSASRRTGRPRPSGSTSIFATTAIRSPAPATG